MANATVSTVTPEEVAQIIEKASKEPGINDVFAILELSQEITEFELARYAMMNPQPIIAEVTGTGSWVRDGRSPPLPGGRSGSRRRRCAPNRKAFRPYGDDP